MNQRTPEGDAHGYVGELLDPNWTPEAYEKIEAEAIDPPRLEGQPQFPAPGIYFGMPEEEYHAIPAASTSGLKQLAVSSMDYWANSHLNPDKLEVEKPHFNLGKAVHAFTLEGEDAYLERYAVQLEPEDFEADTVLFSTFEIKQAIKKHLAPQPVKPLSKKQDLIDQLAELGRANGVKVDLEGGVVELKELVKTFTEDTPVKPVTTIEIEGEDGEPEYRRADKNDWIDQLLELEPDAMIWDDMVRKHEAKHPGKTFISAQIDRRIRIAVRMIEGHEQIKNAFRGGYPEVSIFWYCRDTGVPMKARLDYLKMNAIIDLKSFGNNQGMPIDRAIERTIASYRYNLQHVIYVEAVMAAKRMIEEQGTDCIQQQVHLYDEDILKFCAAWSAQKQEPGFMFVFQQMGNAPVTRGKIMPMGTVYSVTKGRALELKMRWAECAKEYGADPWIDIEPITEIDDDRIPLHATELGKDDT